MKVFLSTDMEGTSGVIAREPWEQCVGDGQGTAAGLTRSIAEAA
jgi:D-aminopeptidase